MSSALRASRPARTRVPASAGAPDLSRFAGGPGPSGSAAGPELSGSAGAPDLPCFAGGRGLSGFTGAAGPPGSAGGPQPAGRAVGPELPGSAGGPELAGRAVVVLHAHPDDEAIFTAATMRRLADRGARVILVMATGGELGERLAPLRPGETVHRRRLAELEDAAEVLGVSRLVLLGRRDSGMVGWPSARHPRALARGRTDRLARRLAEVIDAERADTVLHYDDRGIYGHPDHVAVHRIGALAAAMTGAVSYEATVDRDHLHRRGGTHLIDAASGHTGDYGRAGHEIPVRLTATDAELAAKRAAMAAHASQIAPAAVGGDGFADTYRHEWYLTSHARGLLADLAATPN